MCSRVDGSVQAALGALICTPPESEEPRLLDRDGIAAGASLGLMLSVRLVGALLHLERSSGALTVITLIDGGPFSPPSPGAEITLCCFRRAQMLETPSYRCHGAEGSPNSFFLFYK